MHKLNEDCFYFLTSSCTKGTTCPYRHSQSALTSNTVCSAWSRGQCLNSSCPLRHTNSIQRPIVNHGILCFFEQTPTGCLKIDCTFIHTRPRPFLKLGSNIRPTTTNLVNKEGMKTAVTDANAPAIPIIVSPTKENPSEPILNTSEPSTNQTEVEKETKTSGSSSETKNNEKNCILSGRVVVSTDNQQSSKILDSTVNGPKPSNRCVIQNSPEKKSDESTVSTSRIVLSRNVLTTEFISTPTRKIVQSTTSNRVVVSSEKIDPIQSKLKRDTFDFDTLTEQENHSKKLKSNLGSTTNISSADVSIPTATLVRVIREEKKDSATVYASKQSKANTVPVNPNKSTGSNPLKGAEIATKGTDLSEEDARRSSRIERFKNKPISPTQSKTTPERSIENNNTTETLSTCNSTGSNNEGKRNASQAFLESFKPLKRVSSVKSLGENNEQKILWKPSKISMIEMKTKSSLIPSVTETKQNYSMELTTTTTSSSKFQSPSSVCSMNGTTAKLSKPPSVIIRRPSETFKTSTDNSVEQSKTTTSVESQLVNSIIQPLTSPSTSKIETISDQQQPLKTNDTNNIVDPFALIDAALREADHLLELI